MRQVQWTYLGLMLLIGALLGALLYWWVVSPKEGVPPQQLSPDSTGHSPQLHSKERQTGMYPNDRRPHHQDATRVPIMTALGSKATGICRSVLVEKRRNKRDRSTVSCRARLTHGAVQCCFRTITLAVPQIGGKPNPLQTETHQSCNRIWRSVLRPRRKLPDGVQRVIEISGRDDLRCRVHEASGSTTGATSSRPDRSPPHSLPPARN